MTLGDRLDIRGRTVLITGAARGIGALLAAEVARRGARPALVGIEPETMDSVAARIRSETGVETFVAEADVRDRAALDRAVEGTLSALGSVDVCVANAGVETASSVLNHDPDDFSRVIEINLIAVFSTLQSALPAVMERQGHLLPIASLAAIGHAPGMSAYAASKAGVEALANSLRQELAGTGTTVGCGYFSFLDTDMVRSGFEHPIAIELRKDVMRGPLGKVYPVEPAVVALADGIETRSRTVMYPQWVKAVAAGRGVTQPLLEKLGGKKPAEAIRRAESAS